MNCKAKGCRNERKAKAILEKQGYDLILKAGGSLGLFDLIAISVDHDYALLVQVKSNRNPTKVEMNRLTAFQIPKFCRKQVWLFKDYRKEPLILEL